MVVEMEYGGENDEKPLSLYISNKLMVGWRGRKV